MDSCKVASAAAASRLGQAALCVASALLLPAPWCGAQPAPKKAAFDVVSIKRFDGPPSAQTRLKIEPGRISGVLSLQSLLADAYGVRYSRIVASEDALAQIYEIRAASAPWPGHAALAEMEQSVL